MISLYHFSVKCIIKKNYLLQDGPLKGTVPDENNIFIICFYAIMHRTIVQNKILSIICS